MLIEKIIHLTLSAANNCITVMLNSHRNFRNFLFQNKGKQFFNFLSYQSYNNKIYDEMIYTVKTIAYKNVNTGFIRKMWSI